MTSHDADECSCGRCQHSSPDSAFGFRDSAVAEALTKQMARGQGRPYWLVRSHMGIWYFVAAPKGMPVYTVSATQRNAVTPNTVARELLAYLGCEIVKTFDSRGDEVVR